jgi:hypothetical protein
MPRKLPEKGKTLKVLSTIHVGGLAPGQRAEVDDTPFVRSLLRSGLWLLLVKAPDPVVAPVEEGDDASADLPAGD